MRLKREKTARRLASKVEVVLCGGSISVCVKKNVSLEKRVHSAKFIRDCRVFISESCLLKPRTATRPKGTGLGSEFDEEGLATEHGIRLNVIGKGKVICDMRLPISNLSVTVLSVPAKQGAGKTTKDAKCDKHVLSIAHNQRAVMFEFLTVNELQRWFSVTKETIESRFEDIDQELPGVVQHFEQRRSSILSADQNGEVIQAYAQPYSAPLHPGDMVLLRWETKPKRQLLFTPAIGSKQPPSLVLNVSDITTIQETGSVKERKGLRLTTSQSEDGRKTITHVELALSSTTVHCLLRCLRLFDISIDSQDEGLNSPVTDNSEPSLVTDADTKSTVTAKAQQNVTLVEKSNNEFLPSRPKQQRRRLPDIPQEVPFDIQDSNDEEDDAAYAKPDFRSPESTLAPRLPGEHLPGRWDEHSPGGNTIPGLPAWHGVARGRASWCGSPTTSRPDSPVDHQPLSLPHSSEYLVPADEMGADFSVSASPKPIPGFRKHGFSPLVDHPLPSSHHPYVNDTTGNTREQAAAPLRQRVPVRSATMLGGVAPHKSPKPPRSPNLCNRFHSFREALPAYDQRRRTEFTFHSEHPPSPVLQRQVFQLPPLHSPRLCYPSSPGVCSPLGGEFAAPAHPQAEDWIMSQVLTDSRFAEPVQTELLREVYLKFSNRWKHLGRRLNIDDSDLARIARDCRSTEFSQDDARDEACWSMLNFWLDSLGDSATYLVLIRALKDVRVSHNVIHDVVAFVVPTHAAAE